MTLPEGSNQIPFLLIAKKLSVAVPAVAAQGKKLVAVLEVAASLFEIEGENPEEDVVSDLVGVGDREEGYFLVLRWRKGTGDLFLASISLPPCNPEAQIGTPVTAM